MPFDFPFDFFNSPPATRGAIFKTKNKKFAVSNPAMAPPHDDRFSSLIPFAQSHQFQAFSPKRLFTPVQKNRFSTEFRIPGTHHRASVTGFGAVFVDVDKKRKTFMRYYTKDGCLITKVEVPPRDRGLSFAGVIVLDPHEPHKSIPVIHKVQTKLGTVSIEDFAKGYHGHEFEDVVVTDDFFYGEPQLH